MTIGIDIRVLARGARTGIEEYTINLLARLLPANPDINFKLFYNAYHRAPLQEPWLALPNVKLEEFGLPNRFFFDPVTKFFKRPRVDKMLGGVDVFFSPHFLLAATGNCRRAMVFHDLSFEFFPENFAWRKRLWHKVLAPRQRARQADRIIAVSSSTKNDLMNLYKIPEEKIKVIHSGIGEEFQPIGRDGLKTQKIASRYNLPEKFILYFGTLEPRKNIVGLIRAYEIFRQKYSGDCGLVIAGSRGWLYKDILSLAENSSFRGDIFFTGFIKPAEKVHLYNLASLFVFPSFFEGFGFPPLEAMACGVPVIASNTSSFPEIAGSAALMVDPYNYEEIAWAMNEALSDDNLKRNMAAAGLRHVKNFSWDKCARETLDFITS